MNTKKSYIGESYFDRIRQFYPNELNNPQSPLLFVHSIERWLRSSRPDNHPERFMSICERGFTSDFNVTKCTRNGAFEWPSASQTYKGLLNFKTPFDLQLYMSLIWDLKPQTILEFGAMEGGSALWFADQMTAHQIPCCVKIFERFPKGIHDLVRTHPGIQIQEIDLNNIETELKPAMLEHLPRPWLVIDDAHANMLNVINTVSKYLMPGDYYIVEDIFLTHFWTRPEKINELCQVIDKNDFLVDTKYTDAFGYNVTCAPNSWLKKK